MLAVSAFSAVIASFERLPILFILIRVEVVPVSAFITHSGHVLDNDIVDVVVFIHNCSIFVNLII